MRGARAAPQNYSPMPSLQVRFFEVSEDELVEQRKLFRDGQLPLKIEEESFDMADYNAFVESVAEETAAFKKKQQQAAVEQVLPVSGLCTLSYAVPALQCVRAWHILSLTQPTISPRPSHVVRSAFQAPCVQLPS